MMSAVAFGAALASLTAPSHATTVVPADLPTLVDAATVAPAVPAQDQVARRKPRVPGGSGCDDPRDLIEHPECRAGVAPTTTEDDRLARRKPRVPGGSGCDDPRDLIEHPECRA